MNYKSLFKLLALIAIGVFVWNMDAMETVRDQVRGVLFQQASTVKKVRFNNDTLETSSKGEFVKAPPLEKHGFRKCKRGTEIIYTDTFCPGGTEELQVKNASISIMPGLEKKDASKSALALSNNPNLREKLLGPEEEKSIRAKQIDRVVER